MEPMLCAHPLDRRRRWLQQCHPTANPWLKEEGEEAKVKKLPVLHQKDEGKRKRKLHQRLTPAIQLASTSVKPGPTEMYCTDLRKICCLPADDIFLYYSTRRNPLLSHFFRITRLKLIFHRRISTDNSWSHQIAFILHHSFAYSNH